MTAGVFLQMKDPDTLCIMKEPQDEALLISMHVALTVQLDFLKEEKKQLGDINRIALGHSSCVAPAAWQYMATNLPISSNGKNSNG